MNWIMVLFLRQGRCTCTIHVWNAKIDGPGLVKFDIAYVNNSYFVQNLYPTQTVPNSKCKKGTKARNWVDEGWSEK